MHVHNQCANIPCLVHWCKPVYNVSMEEPLKGSGRKLAASGCDIREWGGSHGISCGHNIENSLGLLPFWIHISSPP